MQRNKDIKIFLEDIERSIKEIFDFLPEKREFIEFQKDLKLVKLSREILKLLVKQ